MNIASGCPLFCALTELNKQSHAHVRDDTMFMKVIVDTGFGFISLALLIKAFALAKCVIFGQNVNHQILLNKVEFYGVRGIPLTWINSYLSNRQEYVDITNNFRSSYKKIKSVGFPKDQYQDLHSS